MKRYARRSKKKKRKRLTLLTLIEHSIRSPRMMRNILEYYRRDLDMSNLDLVN